MSTPSWALKNGVPCSYPGCLCHLTHPCEGCGRIGGVSGFNFAKELERQDSESARLKRKRGWMENGGVQHT